MSRQKTVIQILQEAAKLARFRVPVVAVGSADKSAKTFLSAFHDLGTELREQFNWPQLTKKETLTLVNGQRAYELPEDYDRLVISSTWNQNTDFSVDAPISAEKLQMLEESSVGSQTNQSINIQGCSDSQLFVHPTPGIGAGSLTYLYQSWAWIRPKSWTPSTSYSIGDRVWNNGVVFTNEIAGTSGTTAPTASSLNDGGITWSVDTTAYEYAQADTDIPLIDSGLLIYGLVAHFIEQGGFDASSYMQRYQNRLERVKPRRAGAPVINLTRRDYFFTGQIPEGNWP